MKKTVTISTVKIYKGSTSVFAYDNQGNEHFAVVDHDCIGERSKKRIDSLKRAIICNYRDSHNEYKVILPSEVNFIIK